MPLAGDVANVRTATDLERERRQPLQRELVIVDIFVIDDVQESLMLRDSKCTRRDGRRGWPIGADV